MRGEQEQATTNIVSRIQEYRLKRSIAPLCIVALCLLCGCSMKSNLHRADATVNLPMSTKFKLGETVDASGFSFTDQTEQFSLKDAMAGALAAALAQEGLTSDTAGYIINTRITGYAPGNAFTRWVLPGAGATKLSTESVITTTENVEVARIPVERSIAAGGGYTINALKYVFEEVAKETATVIKTQLLAPGPTASLK